MKSAGKVFVVTGAGSGMGREVVFELLRRGARVAGVDISGKGLATTQQTADSIKADGFAGFVVNVADRAAVQALPAQVLERFGAVDAVLNCAGIIQPFVRLKDLDDATIERVFDVNFKGTLFMVRAFLPTLLTRPTAHIANVSSMGGFLPVPGQSIYGASKAAVKLMTEALFAELQGTNVKVTVIFPGAVATPIVANSGVTMHGGLDAAAAAKDAPKGKALPADEAARQIVDGIEADKSRIYVGNDSAFLDKLYRLSPERATLFIAKQMKSLLS
ncbi:MAG TPA: SDR family oxidoreductase [Myxococcota bacterium]